jgi:hypothetical protein
MPPTGAISVPVRVTGRPNESTQFSPLQGSVIGQCSPRSGAIYLLNWKDPYRERFASYLRSLRLKVFVPEEYGSTAHDLGDDELREADLVIFAFGRPTDAEWSLFLRVCRTRKEEMPLRVIAWVRGYWDAEFHRDLERLADRVVDANE